MRACPFLTQQELERRVSVLPEDVSQAPGLGLIHNPGVALLWITRSYRPWAAPEEAVAEWQAGHVSSAVLLTHNYSDTAWFQHA